MNDHADQSPTFLDMKAGRGQGVRRLNRVPLIIAAILVAMVGGAVIYTYQMRLAEIRRQAAAKQARPEPANISELFDGAPSHGLIEPRLQISPLPAVPAPDASKVEIVVEKQASPLEPKIDAVWERYLQEKAREAAARGQRLRQAISAPTTIAYSRPAVRTSPGDAALADRSRASAPDQLRTALLSQAVRQQGLTEEDEANKDPNRAVEKRAFLNDRQPQALKDHYLPAGREAPVSPFEVKAGTIIPAIMIGGVNSDLPGQIIGQVTENVYDTATGRHILIPQGAKLIGDYDNAVTTGQERVLVAWTRIIYPDASSIDLGKMPGTDAAGYVGFHDKVDNHFWSKFSDALLLSVLSAGAQISQGGQTNDSNGLNAQQTIAAGLGQQLGQLGQEFARRNANVQPTLEIRPGYRFTVSVTRDIVIRPWREP
jgi:type IV secretion system protein VirB10